jgi:hypothetical protein
MVCPDLAYSRSAVAVAAQDITCRSENKSYLGGVEESEILIFTRSTFFS